MTHGIVSLVPLPRHAMRMNISGRWPDEVTIRSNWSKAKGRSWNRDLPYGYVRVIRGNAAFTRAAAEHVLGYDVELVASPPLLKGPDKPWEKAGFQAFPGVAPLPPQPGRRPPDRQPEVTTVASPDFTTFYAIDRSAFNPLWRMEPLGTRGVVSGDNSKRGAHHLQRRSSRRLRNRRFVPGSPLTCNGSL